MTMLCPVLLRSWETIYVLAGEYYVATRQLDKKVSFERVIAYFENETTHTFIVQTHHIQ